MTQKIFKKEIRNFKKYKSFLTIEEFLRAEEIYKDLLANTPVSVENKSHCYQRIFPVLAIHNAIEHGSGDAFERTKDIFFKVEVYPGVRVMRWIFKIPYLYKLVPKIAYKTTKKSYKESDEGFKIDYLDVEKDILRINIRQCPYLNYCKMFGHEELCDIFCESDEIAAQAMGPHVVFERENTLARGGEYCDFSYSLRDKK